MNQALDQDVAKLYAIRAGMSILSELNDDGQATKRRLGNHKNRIPAYQNEIAATRKKLEEKKATYKKDYGFASALSEDANKTLLKRIFFTILSLLPISALVTVILYFSFSLGIDYLFFMIVVWSIIVFLGFIVTTAFVSANIAFWSFIIELIFDSYIGGVGFEDSFKLILKYTFIHPFKNFYLLYKNIIKKINSDKYLKIEKEKLEKIENNQDEDFIEFEKKCKSSIKQYEEAITSSESQISREIELLREISGKFKIVYLAMQEEFSEFLCENDWGNVDLIIHKYESNRVIDLRDALLQVDADLRNRQLVNAVNNARDAICTSLNRGFRSLQGYIAESFYSFEAKIADLSSGITNVAETAVLQEAAIRKINTSSERMAKDIGDMLSIARTYS